MPGLSPWVRAILVGLVLAAAASAHAQEPQKKTRKAAKPPGQSKSGYEEPDAIPGGQTVGTQLVQDDTVDKALVDFEFIGDWYYEWKGRLREKHGIEFNADYNLLNQFASSGTDDPQASSGSVRFYGRWQVARNKGRTKKRGFACRPGPSRV